MIADDIPAANGGETNSARHPLAGIAFTCVNCDFGELSAERSRDHLTHLQRSAGRRINLVPMVCLNNFYVVTRVQIQCLGRRLQQFESNVHTHAHIGSKYN